MASCMQGVEERRSDEVFWRRDGTSFPVDYVATPIREGDDPGAAVVVFRDVTDERRAEDERRDMERHLIQSERMASHRHRAQSQKSLVRRPRALGAAAE